jgi:type I restriction enzyme R subunit
MNEADTCDRLVRPKLVKAGWDEAPHSIAAQREFTAGRISVVGGRVWRGRKKRADYLLRYTRDFALAVVEAKADYKAPADGLQQAKEYAQILDLSFAYATNGQGIVEFDFLTGLERELPAFPGPQELWRRLKLGKNLDAAQARIVLESYNRQQADQVPRYYQDIAIHRVVEAIAQGRRRVLLTMATGTGKTATAFQICWKLWSSGWNLRGDSRKPRILYLADRNILVDDPMAKDFSVFGDALHKIANGEVVRSREMYFAIYQAIAEDQIRPGLYKEYKPEFFDLIIVDECHRGSARSESSWREILEHFAPAAQLGMTATPLREDNRDTYTYFGNPIYTYSLRQGIEDGFLAPYRVHRIVTTADATGWRPSKGEVDRYGREIPDELYGTKDFERTIALRARTQAIAKHLTEFLRANGHMGKTIVFCVDQEHAEEMRRALNNLNADLARRYPNYVCRVTSDEGDVGRGYLSDFQDIEKAAPVILTTSQLLTTGVNAPTVQNVVLARVVGSMTEFKQIIGRGTRVREDCDKLFFNILDYTGSATQHFADPDFDGEPAFVEEVAIDDEGDVTSEEILQPETPPNPEDLETEITLGGGAAPEGEGDGPPILHEPPEPSLPRKYYVDGGIVSIVHRVVYELDADGNQLAAFEYADYSRKQVRRLAPSVEDLCRQWSDPTLRERIVESLQERGINFESLAEEAGRRDADPFDLLCRVAFDAPLLTRRERAERLKSNRQDLFDRYGPEARAVLDDLLDQYAAHGVEQLKLPDALKVPAIARRGNVSEIAGLFGGAEHLRAALSTLQTGLYAQ